MSNRYLIHKTDSFGNPTKRYWKLVYNAALRLGYSVPLQEVVELEFVGDIFPNSAGTAEKHDPTNVRFIGQMKINGHIFNDIVFVHTTKYDRPKFITFWPRSEDANAAESTVEPLVTLAMRGEGISPEEVVEEMHPEFQKNPGIDPLILINRAKNLAEEQVSMLINLAEEWKDQAKVEKARAEDLIEEKLQLEAENKLLNEENNRLKAEQDKAKATGSFVLQNKSLTLVSVETDVLVRNSLNTVLTFEDGSQKSIKVSTFDRNLSVTEKAKSLLGKKVVTTCWDPINEPGKWSSLGYFRNIYEDL